MNKTAIEWCDQTWNPVTGCEHGCPYCYARKIAERFRGSKAWPFGFKPTVHFMRFADPIKIKKPQTIFVCSMADLFGEWVNDDWINGIFASCQKAPQHTYIFLTKNPGRIEQLSVHSCFEEFMNSKNAWFGTTITGEEDSIDRLGHLIASDLPNRFISFEPLLKYPFEQDEYNGDLTGIKQVIIGAQTNPFVPPNGDAVRTIVDSAVKVGAKIFFKDSMAGVQWLGHMNQINTRELCWTVHK